jgi:hypothetical protein
MYMSAAPLDEHAGKSSPEKFYMANFCLSPVHQHGKHTFSEKQKKQK